MKLLCGLIFLVLISLIFPQPSFAIEDPLSVTNNKFGIHILFTTELIQAARLVNSNGGDWGYITVPIQSTDKNLEKWQAFMDSARQNHIIPIIRIATENYYFNSTVWRKPDDYDIVDFANFLNALNWPTKNRYVIIFNEVNRGDEWGGEPNPAEYAQILSFASDAFEQRSSDFFILSAGLDNASANVNNALNEYDFLRAMAVEVSDVFKKIDGIASHSYPNPGFSQPPTNNGRQSIATFKHERTLLQTLGAKSLPVFITETGWSRNAISSQQAYSYYKYAFSNVWNDPGVVAVTPFLLKAGPPFEHFSFLNSSDLPTEEYKAVEEFPKQAGLPLLTTILITPAPTPSPSPNTPFGIKILGAKTYEELPTIDFSFEEKPKTQKPSRKEVAMTLFAWFFKF